VLSGSLLMMALAVLFHHLQGRSVPYPHHWL
jgi:CBS-domain-containing membrane protein